MTHFDIADWADFARGVTAEPTRASMEAHLAQCVRCHATLALLQRVLAASRAEPGLEPPEHAVRAAQALGVLLGPPRPLFRRLVPRLVYDSLRDPAPVGIRSEGEGSRRAVYEAGDFTLELRLERETGAPFVTLVGQLTNRTDPEAPLPESPVLLFAQKKVVAHALSNRFGEFYLECPPGRDLRLSIALPPSPARLDLPLTGLIGLPPAEPRRGGGGNPKKP